MHERVQLETLAIVAGVRPRTLEKHFKLFLGTTPLGWVRRMRLSLARQKLITAGSDATVTGVALASGFGQLGQFAVQYRQQFGERPAQTLKRTRGMADEIHDEALRLTWRALPAAHSVAPRECNAALEDLALAEELAPTYPLAKAIAAWCWGQRAAQHFGRNPSEDQARARRLAEEVCALAPDDPMVLTHCSGALVLAHRIEEADRLIEHALALDPWNALAWHRRGWISAYVGDCEAARRELSIALHLMPFGPPDTLPSSASVVPISQPAATIARRVGRRAAWKPLPARSGESASWLPRPCTPARALRRVGLPNGSCVRIPI